MIFGVLSVKGTMDIELNVGLKTVMTILLT
jgi:hypothetical protein